MMLIGCELAAPARAEIDIKFGGVLSSDIRYRLAGEEVDSPYPSQYKLLKYGFSRNENLIKTQLTLGIADKVKAVGDVDLYLYGYSDANDIDALTLHERIDPYRVEVNSAYIDVYKVLKGLDLRIGRQVVVWGAADKFNPTNNVNTMDFSDPLLFGKALGNNMIRADYNPIGDWVFTAVFVPIFRPAELPRTAPLALRDLTRPAPVQQDDIRATLLEDVTTLYHVNQVNVLTYQPDPSWANTQWAFRAAGRLWGQDVSLSYYHGRFGVPVPAAALFHLQDGTADVAVAWPREDVIGADIAGSIEKLHGVGYWLEGAVTIPGQIDFAVYEDQKSGNTLTHYEERYSPAAKGSPYAIQTPVRIGPDGSYLDPVSGIRGTVIPTTPFFKLTVGADYSIGSHVYINGQYVHGFIDEFGAGVQPRPKKDPTDPNEQSRLEQRIGDYLVAGCDLKLLSDRLLLRLFAVLKLPSIDWTTKKLESYDPTGVLFPQIAYAVWDATELSVGAFVYLGDRSTKFGDPAAGASEIFAKAKFTY